HRSRTVGRTSGCGQSATRGRLIEHIQIQEALVSTVESRIAELGLDLPAPFPAAGDYVPCRRSGPWLFVSGHGPMRDGKAVYTGKLGGGVDIETGRASAELTMLNVLAS